MDHSTQLMGLVEEDSSLYNYNQAIRYRNQLYLNKKQQLCEAEGSLEEFARGFTKYGLHNTPTGFVYREWAPGATALSLFGDFNDWNRDQYFGEKDEYGTWTVFIPNGNPQPQHGSKLKACLTLPNGSREDRIPAWASYVVQNQSSWLFECVHWDPPQKFEWKYPEVLEFPPTLRIYEAHIGMCSEYPKVATYSDFMENVLPKIKENGYNCIQLMAIMEHAYYGSFGYHVTNFFAVSSRYGTPDELKALIDKAHQLGIVVFLDMIHSHASSNVMDGINYFDGTDHHYFHAGSKGRHNQWDSRLFNYGHWEVLRFLLSNIRWYLEEYNFDGIRFDGVTSMLYLHHGINFGFSGGYHEYFNTATLDHEACTYLMLANDLIHSFKQHAVTIAEDVSGMPGLCRPLHVGGFGFDYRLNMSVPDKWIQLLKEVKDDK